MNRFRCRLQLNLNTFAGVRHPCRSGSGRRHTSFTRFFKARLGTLRLRITKVGLFPELTNLFHSRFARRKRRKAHAATGAEPANHASANHFVKPSAEPNEVRTMPRREMDERNSRLFPQSVLRLPTADPSGSPAGLPLLSFTDRQNTPAYQLTTAAIYNFISRRISEPLHPTDSRNLRRRAVFADWPRSGGSFEQAPLR